MPIFPLTKPRILCHISINPPSERGSINVISRYALNVVKHLRATALPSLHWLRALIAKIRSDLIGG